MDPNLDARLIAIEKKVEENNQILVRMRRVQKTANLMRWGYILVIILITWASYYFIKPYLGQLGAAYGIGGDSSETSGTTTNYADILKQLQEFQKGQ